MKLYLKWINPAVCVLILAICTWIYFGGYFVEFDPAKKSLFQKGINIIDPGEMNFAMYFFAKGLFCSSLLFIVGRFFYKKIESDE